MQLKIHSQWTPSKTPHCIKSFITAVNSDISESGKKKLSKNNLAKEERNALKILVERTDILITNADKGAAVVMWDANNYITEVNRQLENRSSCRKLSIDCTEIHTEKVRKTITNLTDRNLLDKSTANKLTPPTVKTPRFHMRPKIHNYNNPGRPVVSLVASHTGEISKLVDHYLQDNVKQLKSYVKDNTDFINKIEQQEKIPKGSFLILIDVRF